MSEAVEGVGAARGGGVPDLQEGRRVLVELRSGYCDVLVEGWEVEGSRLRLFTAWAEHSRLSTQNILG